MKSNKIIALLIIAAVSVVGVMAIISKVFDRYVADIVVLSLMILYDIFIICHIVFKTVKNKKAGTTASENDKLKNVESIAGCCLYTSFALRWVLDSIIPYVMALPAIILLIVCSHKKNSTENKPTDYEENK